MSVSLSFFNKMRRLDALVNRQGPITSRMKDLSELLNDEDVRREFFNRLTDASWIGPLRVAGYFDLPMPVKRLNDSSVRVPVWPASKYLARVAEEAPEEVADILSGIRTDNPSVISDILEAAANMPVDIAATLSQVVCKAARDRSLWFGFDHASKFCLRLAEGEQLDAAMELAEALFTPTFVKDREEPSHPEDYWLKEGLTAVVPILARSRPQKFLPMLCGWLRAAIEAKTGVNRDTGADYSYSWRPAIEDHAQNHDFDFAASMVGFVRLGFEEAVGAKSLSPMEALEIVGRDSYLVFRRIKLHLINEFAEQLPELATESMLDHELFEDYRFKHEYAMLIGNRFQMLSRDDQQEWFGWVEAGPDLTDHNEFIREQYGRDATEEEKDSRTRYWQFEKLYWVRTHLQGDWREFYENMLRVHGEPELADLNVRHGGWHRLGSESPMTVESLSSMSFEEAVKAVATWTPEEERFDGPSRSGLASTFSQYLATDPERFSMQATALIGAPADIVRSFVSQMREAAKSGRAVDVPRVLALCQWVVEQPVGQRTTPPGERRGLVDPDWQWTRDAISDFIDEVSGAMHDESPRYPLEGIRAPMRELVLSLYQDPPQTNIGEDRTQHDHRVHDYLMHGINSSRGQAVEAALEYARWVANHIKQKDGDREVVPGGFDAMPEVREIIEWQIAPENRTLEALSVIGRWMGLIYWIDKGWLEQNTDKMFDLEGIERDPPEPHGWALWNAFLVWCSPHIEFYRLFKRQFTYAVEQAADVELPERPSREQPMNRLGEHLILLYGRGQLGLDDDDGLLRSFMETANPDVRRHAIAFVGRSLKDEDEDEETDDQQVPSDVINRFMDLWKFYWDNQGTDDAKDKPDAWLFGTWAGCGRFPAQWTLDQLYEFTKVAPIPEPERRVAKRLVKIASVDPLKAVSILDSMTRADKEGWKLGWRESAMTILELAMKSSNEARAVAERLIDHLGRRGYMEFGKLLDLAK